MRAIYLAGPMAGCTNSEMNAWRDKVTAALSPYYTIFNPVVRDFREGYEREQHEAVIVEGDKADVDKSDIVLAFPWKHGAGTAMEIMYAYMQGKCILMIAPPQEIEGSTGTRTISPWYSYHADFLFDDVDQAITFLMEMGRL